jgi:hypothetical protein
MCLLLRVLPTAPVFWVALSFQQPQQHNGNLANFTIIYDTRGRYIHSNMRHRESNQQPRGNYVKNTRQRRKKSRCGTVGDGDVNFCIALLLYHLLELGAFLINSSNSIARNLWCSFATLTFLTLLISAMVIVRTSAPSIKNKKRGTDFIL